MLSIYYVPVCLCACPQLGPGIVKGERGVDIGGGDPRSPPTRAHTPTQLHKLTFLPVVSRYLSFSSLSLSSLHVSPSLSPSALPSPFDYFSSQALSL